jgi:O-antigen/teichoic acid export membrane protein
MSPPARAWQRLRALAGESLYRNSAYIMGTTAVTSLLGFGFWVIAARGLDTVEVGRSAALISAMLFVSVFTNLGLGQVFVSRLASRAPGHEWSLTVTLGITVAALASLVGGALAAVLLPLLIPALKGGLGAGTFILLPFGVVGSACSLVIDYACIAEREAKLSFVRNAAAAVVRIALIPLVSLAPGDPTTWILALWTASFLLIDVYSIIRDLPALGHEFAPTLHGWREELVRMRGLIAGHQSINLGAQATTLLLPVLVSARLGPTQNAYFYTTFMLASSIFFIAPAVGNALFAEGIHHPAHLNRDLRRAVRQVAVLAGPPALVLLIAGPTILGVFGSEYADAGTSLLRILVGVAVIDAVQQLGVAVLRIRHRLREAATATWLMLAVAVGATWLLLPPEGLEGAGLGWGLGKLTGMVLTVLFAVRGRAANPSPARV